MGYIVNGAPMRPEDAAPYLCAVIEDFERRIGAALALHRPRTDWPHSHECTECDQIYPCDTVRAIDPKETTE